MIEFLREHPRELKISIIFGIFNVLLPLGLVVWLFDRATEVRHPLLGLSQPRDEANPWLIFFVFIILLIVISLIQIRYFRISKQNIATYYLPCAVGLGFVIVNLLVPFWLLGWAMQDFADRGLGIFSDPANPANPARPIFRLVFAFVVTVMIVSTEIVATRAYLARR